MPEPEEMSREELIALVRRQDGQITTLATLVADHQHHLQPGCPGLRRPTQLVGH